MWTTNILTAGKTLPGLKTYLFLKSVPHANTICSAASSKQHTINRSGLTSQAPSPCLLAATWITPRSNIVPGFKTQFLELAWCQKEQSLLALVCWLTLLTQRQKTHTTFLTSSSCFYRFTLFKISRCSFPTVEEKKVENLMQHIFLVKHNPQEARAGLDLSPIKHHRKTRITWSFYHFADLAPLTSCPSHGPVKQTKANTAPQHPGLRE